MSTGCECEFFVFKGQHYYILEHYNAPKNSFDWHEHADVYGPFSSYKSAEQHLSDTHANPGGWSHSDDEMANSRWHGEYSALVARAIKPRARNAFAFRYWR
jgi:hypothetical protein